MVLLAIMYSKYIKNLYSLCISERVTECTNRVNSNLVGQGNRSSATREITLSNMRLYRETALTYMSERKAFKKLKNDFIKRTNISLEVFYARDEQEEKTYGKI